MSQLEVAFREVYKIDFSRRTVDIPFWLSIIEPGDSVLELFCGAGRVGSAIKSKFPSVEMVGVEIDPVLADMARSTYNTVHAMNVIDFIKSLLMCKERFDKIIVPYHSIFLVDFKKQAYIWDCCREFLKPGGCLYVEAYVHKEVPLKPTVSPVANPNGDCFPPWSRTSKFHSNKDGSVTITRIYSGGGPGRDLKLVETIWPHNDETVFDGFRGLTSKIPGSIIYYSGSLTVCSQVAIRKARELAVFNQPPPKSQPESIEAWPHIIERLKESDNPMAPMIMAMAEARHQFGMSKYGVALKSHDGRSTQADYIQELLDALVYAQKGALSSYGFERTKWESRFDSVLALIVQECKTLV